MLIIVLGLVVLVSLLAVSMVSLSQGAYRLSAIETNREEAAYFAEDAAARMIWLLRDDISKHPNRTLGRNNDAMDLAPRYPADGSVYTIINEDAVNVSVSLSDATTGLDISGRNPGLGIRQLLRLFPEDDERRHRFLSFSNALGDYVDANGLSRQNGGVEREGYEALLRYPLPRNRPMRYKWEICWIPGCSKFFKADKYGEMPEFRIIAPWGVRRLRGRSNFFSAGKKVLKAFAKLSDEEVVAVMKARSAWKRDKTPLTENLPVGLLGRLRGRFSFRESGSYAFLIKVPVGADGGWRILSLALRMNRYLSTRKKMIYYKWRFLR